MAETIAPAKPAGFEDDLGDYEVAFIDSLAQEPIAWGFKLIRHMGEDRFAALKEKGELVYKTKEVVDGVEKTIWYFVVKRLTRLEAAAKYGAHMGDEYGPRGGWQTVTFGTKKFKAKQLSVPKA